MELIYRDEAIKAIDDVLMEDEQYKVWLKLSIKNIKPVDAVPVSYIQDRIDHLQELKEYEAEANGGYTGQVHTEVYALRRLINYWKEERDVNQDKTD